MNTFFEPLKGFVSTGFFSGASKRQTALFFLLLLLPVLFFGQAIDRRNYFIAHSHDGNTHDLDDIVASPIAIALYGEQGLWNKVLHCQYNDNLGGDKNSARMRESVNGAVQKWGLDGSKVFDIQTLTMTVSAAAKANFTKAAQTAMDKGAILYFICAEPMEAPYQAVENLSPELKKVVHVISHSGWNDKFQRNPSCRVWTDLINCRWIYPHKWSKQALLQ